MKPSTIGGINQLPEEEKRRIYYGLIPRELLEHFHLPRIELAAISTHSPNFNLRPVPATWKCRCFMN